MGISRKGKRSKGVLKVINKEKDLSFKKAQIKLNGYLNEFVGFCYFQEEKLDWNVLSENKFIELKRKWRAYCRNKNYSGEIMAAFHWDCMLLKTDLILQCKEEKMEFDKYEILFYLKKGMTPLEVAEYLIKNKNK